MTEEQLKKLIFRIVDHNNDEMVSKKEILTFFSQVRKFEEKQALLRPTQQALNSKHFSLLSLEKRLILSRFIRYHSIVIPLGLRSDW